MKSKQFRQLILLILVISTASITMILNYPAYNEKTNDIKGSYYSSSLSIPVFESTISLAYEQQNNTENISVYDFLFGKDNKKEAELKQKQTAANLIDEWKANLRGPYANFDYVYRNTATKATMYRNGNLVEVLNKNSDDTKKALKDEYQWWIKFSFDENGLMTIKDTNSTSSTSQLQNYYEQTCDIIIDNMNSNYTEIYDENGNVVNKNYFEDTDLIGIKNAEFLFAIPKELEEVDHIYYLVNDNNTHYYDLNIFQNAFYISVILALISFFYPIKRIKENEYFNKLKKIPLEIWMVFATCAIGLMASGSDIVLLITNRNHLNNLTDNERLLAYGINFALWFMIFAIFFLGVLYLKCLIKKGIWKSFKEDTLTGRILRWMKRSFKNIGNSLNRIDLSDQSNQHLFLIIIANFFIVFILMTMDGLGIFLMVIYSAILFICAGKFMDKMRKDYTALKDATRNIAKGDLESDIKEDLGIFEPFKEDMKEIRTSFKQAVDDEVRSQKMKTELISNVSHDLKTPLTSIITYVDLLRNSNPSDEEKAKYLDTLDRNSIRLKNLIDDLFEVSKANSGNLSLNQIDINIVSLMKQILFENEDRLNKKQLSIRENYSDEKIILHLDSQKTYRIFQNLIGNIAKYAMSGSRVYIEIVDYGEQVELSFKNISENEINFDPSDIVERFVRGDKSRNTEGSGLGLAIAKSFTELQMGSFKIIVDGDLFKVTLRFKKQRTRNNDTASDTTTE